jgi:hypothetical protein
MLQIAPGIHSVTIHCRVVGGKTTKSVIDDSLSELSGDTSKVVKQVTVVVDNVKERKRADDFAARARNDARGFGQMTVLGYLIRADDVEKFRERVKERKAEAQALTEELVTCKVDYEAVADKIVIDPSPETVALVQRLIREDIENLGRCLTEGNLEARNVYNKIRNVAVLACGIQADAINYALTEAKEHIQALVKADREGKPLPKVGHLPALGNAVDLFSPSDPSAVPDAL